MDPKTYASQTKGRGGGDNGRNGRGRGSSGKPSRGNPRQQPGPQMTGGHLQVWGNGNPSPPDKSSHKSKRGGGRGGGSGREGNTRIGNSAGQDEMAVLNFENIRRMDPYIKSIIDHSSQVAIFTYTNNRWNEALAVGSLFMYERSGHDPVGMVIMNRQSVENWIHKVTEKFELVIQPPYWLVKDGESIFCIWFYNANDILKLATIFTSFNYSVVMNEGGNIVESGPKPPNLMASAGAQKTGETLGDALLAMLTKSKTGPIDGGSTQAPGANLLNLIAKSDPTKKEDSMAHPLPIKPEPVSPLQAFKQSPTSKVQLRTPGASSFAEVAARPKRNKETAETMLQQTGKPEVKKDDGPTGFRMQTVEQLEMENMKKQGPGPNLGGHGFLTHEHLAHQSPSEIEKTHQKMTNDLRAKLGLPPCVYSVSPENDKDPTESTSRYYSENDDNYIGLSVSNVSSPESSRFDGKHGSVWPQKNDEAPSIWPFTTGHGSSDGLDLSLSSFTYTKEEGYAFKQPEAAAPAIVHPIAEETGHNISKKYQNIDDIHGKEISEVEAHEVDHVLSSNPEQAKYLKLMPQPDIDGSGIRLVWTNVLREKEYGPDPRPFNQGFSAETQAAAQKIGIHDLPLTADQLTKTFKLLLQDQDFVAKFHNAYLQVRSEEGRYN